MELVYRMDRKIHRPKYIELVHKYGKLTFDNLIKIFNKYPAVSIDGDNFKQRYIN